MPRTAVAISPSTFATARSTDLPPYTPASTSRSSTASCAPVDAPEGTAARPSAPDSSRTSTSTVGFPRESSTCRPCTSRIAVTHCLPFRLELLRALVPSLLRVEVERRPLLARLGRQLDGPFDPRDP